MINSILSYYFEMLWEDFSKKILNETGKGLAPLFTVSVFSCHAAVNTVLLFFF